MNCNLNSCPLKSKFHSDYTSLPCTVLHESDLIIQYSVVMTLKFLGQNIDSCTGYLKLLFVPLRIFHSHTTSTLQTKSYLCIAFIAFGNGGFFYVLTCAVTQDLRFLRLLILTSKCWAHGKGIISTYFNVWGLVQPQSELCSNSLTMTELLLDLHSGRRNIRGAKIKRT
jgi:hypothetical protein